ncbi:DUF6075 family protein [Jeotgalibacillus proteolyticus]|uniref:Uncharacterized protein n=1 Tax=Jeotgalibacillus proteolyticus TaxID=2082395 RepID=A0A2S5G6U8_9BACL|nr:DUF6075 family protein [Jeotgalibacillus proteolyticus]PPA68673.1 hypothetical protein C4B60_19060 [Jeotgalibacillus proteolyticus]PPA68750.1 hypothetical protein C4B60_19490 [Jeotgalibacillus proteolyticus]
MNFSFLNREHQERFQEIRETMPIHTRRDKEYLSLVFVMTGDDELFNKMIPYFNKQDCTLSSTELFEEQDFSSGINVLAKLGVHLFNNNVSVEPLDFMSLDEQRMALAMNALLIRRYGLPSPYEETEEKLYS